MGSIIESVADLEVNMHNLRPKIEGPLDFSDSEEEEDPNVPANVDEALAIDARGEIDDPDTTDDQSIKQKTTAKMFEGLLHFSDSEDEEEMFFERAHGFALSIEEAITADGEDVVEGTDNEGVIGEQEGNLSSLTDSNPD